MRRQFSFVLTLNFFVEDPNFHLEVNQHSLFRIVGFVRKSVALICFPKFSFTVFELKRYVLLHFGYTVVNTGTNSNRSVCMETNLLWGILRRTISECKQMVKQSDMLAGPMLLMYQCCPQGYFLLFLCKENMRQNFFIISPNDLIFCVFAVHYNLNTLDKLDNLCIFCEKMQFGPYLA